MPTQCSSTKHADQGACPTREEHPGQEVVFFGCRLLTQTLYEPPLIVRLGGGCYSSSCCWETISCSWPGRCNYNESTANSPSSIPADWPHLEHTTPPFPFYIQSWLLHNEQHLVLICPQKPKQHQKEEGGRIWEELAAEEIHRKAVREWSWRSSMAGGETDHLYWLQHPLWPSENLPRPSVTQHAVSILGQMYTKVRTRGGKGRRRGDGDGGVWGKNATEKNLQLSAKRL